MISLFYFALSKGKKKDELTLECEQILHLLKMHQNLTKCSKVIKQIISIKRKKKKRGKRKCKREEKRKRKMPASTFEIKNVSLPIKKDKIFYFASKLWK